MHSEKEVSKKGKIGGLVIPLGFSIKSPGFSEREYTMDVERKSSADVRKNE